MALRCHRRRNGGVESIVTVQSIEEKVDIEEWTVHFVEEDNLQLILDQHPEWRTRLRGLCPSNNRILQKNDGGVSLLCLFFPNIAIGAVISKDAGISFRSSWETRSPRRIFEILFTAVLAKDIPLKKTVSFYE